MKTVVAILAAFAIAGTALAASSPPPDQPQKSVVTCEQVLAATQAVERASDFVAVDVAMSSIGFPSSSPYDIAMLFNNDLAKAKSEALRILKDQFAGLNCTL